MYQIIWQPGALVQFSELLYHVDTQYGTSVGEKLLADVQKKVSLLQSNPFLYRKTNHSPSVRRCLVNKHIVLYYQVNKTKRTVRLLTFWDNRQDPDKNPKK